MKKSSEIFAAITPPETNIAPKNEWLECPVVEAYFQGLLLLVSGSRVCWSKKTFEVNYFGATSTRHPTTYLRLTVKAEKWRVETIYFPIGKAYVQWLLLLVLGRVYDIQFHTCLFFYDRLGHLNQDSYQYPPLVD